MENHSHIGGSVLRTKPVEHCESFVSQRWRTLVTANIDVTWLTIAWICEIRQWWSPDVPKRSGSLVAMFFKIFGTGKCDAMMSLAQKAMEKCQMKNADVAWLSTFNASRANNSELQVMLYDIPKIIWAKISRVNHTYLAQGGPWSVRWIPRIEALPLHYGGADICDYPKRG